MSSRNQQELRARFDLEVAQVRAIDHWNRSRRLVERAAETTSMTRQMRVEAGYRAESRRREHAALIARAHQQLAATGQPADPMRHVRLVIAHRNAWLRDKVTTRLRERGVEVVASVADGADAAGAIVAEQPELVLVEDLLPSLRGHDLVRRARSFSPDSIIAAQVADSGGVEGIIDAGAHAVFTRRVPPVEVADELLGCLDASSRGHRPLLRT